MRLHIHDDRFLVCCACPPVEASPGAILSVRPSVNALVTLPAGWTWPDPAGEALADAVMQKGGGFMFECERLADALACATRLKASRQ